MEIDGIKVLTEKVEEITTSIMKDTIPIQSYLLWGIAAILFIGFILLIIKLVNINKEHIIFILILPIAALVSLFIVLGGDAASIETTYEVKTYSCLIDDSVSFNEVINKYTYLGQDGNIIYLQEKVPS